MKKFIEKLIGRLEEEKNKDVCDNIRCVECHQRYKTDSYDTCYQPIQMLAYDNVIQIINELAEEYAKTPTHPIPIDTQQYIAELEAKINSNGWIPCSERLPEVNG